MTQPSPEKPHAGPTVTLAVLTTVFGLIERIADTVKDTFGAFRLPAGRLRWASHIPKLARVVADMLELAPRLFGWVPFTAAELRAREVEVHHLGILESILTGLLEEVRQLLRVRKHELLQSTTLVVEGMRRSLDSPMIDAEALELLRSVSAPALDLVDDRLRAVRAVRRKNRATATGEPVSGASRKRRQRPAWRDLLRRYAAAIPTPAIAAPAAAPLAPTAAPEIAVCKISPPLPASSANSAASPAMASPNAGRDASIDAERPAEPDRPVQAAPPQPGAAEAGREADQESALAVADAQARARKKGPRGSSKLPRRGRNALSLPSSAQTLQIAQPVGPRACPATRPQVPA